MSNKSIIEDWKNQLKSDEFYEERAVDVIFSRPSSSSPLSGANCQQNSSTTPPRTRERQKTKNHHQETETIRSIPLKHYQATLAQDMGSLRRPTLPHHQFESLVSEPDRTHDRTTARISSRQTKKKSPTNSKPKKCSNTAAHASFRFLDDSTVFLDHNPHQERSNVGQMISHYEGNTQEGKKPNFYNLKNYKTIGVPLVGMHNACGLPVLGAWSNERFQTLQVPRDVFRKLEKNTKNARTLVRPRKNGLKRKAPQPQTIGKSEEFNRARESFRKKSLRHSNFRNGLKLNQQSYSRMERTKNNDNKNGFNKTRRATLYAKDDGSDAVNVLTSLCLNPMAKSSSNMIW